MSSHVHTPASSSRYATALREAVAFTRSLQGTCRTELVLTPSIVTDSFSEIIREWARLNLCSRRDEALAGMCMRITEELTEFLMGAGIDCIYTLGWMSYKGHPVYKFGHEDIKRWLAEGVPDRQRVDVHAWVTLPSAEIIDPSWLSTVGIVQNRRDLIGAVIIADPEQSTSHQYHPVTVDVPLLYRMGMLRHAQSQSAPVQAPPPPEILAAAT